MIKRIREHQLHILIAVMVAVVGFIVWGYITPGKKIEEAARQIEEIAREVRQSFVNQIDYWGLSTKNAVAKNILTILSYDDNKLINALGKPVQIGSGENGGIVMPGERSFDVVYDDLSMGECVALATYHFERPEELGLLQITIINEDGSQSFSWGEENYKLPISRQEAKRFCRNVSKVLWTLE